MCSTFSAILTCETEPVPLDSAQRAVLMSVSRILACKPFRGEEVFVHPYVVFVNWKRPKTNTTNIHLTSCGYYQRFLKNGPTQNTKWIEAPDLEAAKRSALQEHKKYGTWGVSRARCCFPDASAPGSDKGGFC